MGNNFQSVILLSKCYPGHTKTWLDLTNTFGTECISNGKGIGLQTKQKQQNTNYYYH